MGREGVEKREEKRRNILKNSAQVTESRLIKG
jgi:hypothetical protein